MNDKLYRVAWRIESTGVTGHGNPLSRNVAEAWVERCNREHPDMMHWVETIVEGEWYPKSKGRPANELQSND